HDLGVVSGRRFGHSIRAGCVVGTGHDNPRAEATSNFQDALVVGGNDCAMEVPRLRSPFENVLQHGFGGDLCQNLAREARGAVSRWDNPQDFTRHTRSYHKILMLDLGKERLASLMLPSYRKLLLFSKVSILLGAALLALSFRGALAQ